MVSRPWTLWFISLIIAMIGLYNVALAVQHAPYRVSYPPALRIVTALAWGAGLLALAVGLARRRQWARRWNLAILSNYGAFGVLWHIVYTRSDFGRDRLAFHAALTLLLVGLAVWGIRWRWKESNHDQQPSQT